MWGGSIALKRDVLEAAGLLETWSNSLSTDCVLPTLVKRIGRRIAFAPNAIMVNSERISLADLIPWVTRQSLVVRLYHTYWSGVLTRATFLCTLVAGSILLMGIGACTGRWQICSMALATLVLHWFTNVTCLLWLDHAVRQRLKYVGAEVPAFHGRRLGRAFVGMVLANLAFLVSLGHAAAARQVAWRGIQYRIHSRFQIEMTGYRLFSGEPQEAESVSLV